MKKILKLTKAQEKQIPVFIDKFIKQAEKPTDSIRQSIFG